MVTRMLSCSSTSTRLELIEKAETYLYRMIQEESFPAEISALQDNKEVLPTSKLFKLSPFLDEKGVMRVGGRLHNTRWEFGRQHPIILAKHYLTELLISKFHIQRKHQGVEALLAFIYQKFWIIGGRRLVRRIKQQCVQCRRYDAQPCAEVTAPLPEGRVAFNRPFGFCGIDHAGPLLAKAQQNPCKVWLALFVCGATRAVHIEVVTRPWKTFF